MRKSKTRHRQVRDDRQRGATAVEFALILPLLLSMLLGVIDFGIAFGQSVSLQGAARESARQGVTQGDVIASANHAAGSLDSSQLQVRFAVDTSAGAPGVMVVCLRYPESSLTGFYSWVLGGVFEAKAVMKMESPAVVASGAQRWTGGSCTP
ncbi:TadE/TadG family type IV pilus assembly protein [Arthrobacter sp. PsM3]|uniref:TadE/TadG family type IV pilus assembly protein n=1 Tax=Arthrobacter sp. PsM3 TaxID=3030531 RepID=UPI00263A477B|nr:TadE/TadG family type IV pilus assembly protein [Arthrobacter sp. PsM3]MDN4642706.1 TadE/TadG family type IV pilus assembly protein [Arthrobacter sp. PsM3]